MALEVVVLFEACGTLAALEWPEALVDALNVLLEVPLLRKVGRTVRARVRFDAIVHRADVSFAVGNRREIFPAVVALGARSGIKNGWHGCNCMCVFDWCVCVCVWRTKI